VNQPLHVDGAGRAAEPDELPDRPRAGAVTKECADEARGHLDQVDGPGES
jgi:hypothetical protein